MPPCQPHTKWWKKGSIVYQCCCHLTVAVVVVDGVTVVVVVVVVVDGVGVSCSRFLITVANLLCGCMFRVTAA